jgi:S1-C subfamily serine protease
MIKKMAVTLIVFSVFFGILKVNSQKSIRNKLISVQASQDVSEMLERTVESFVRVEKSIMVSGVRQATGFGSGVVISKTLSGNVILTNYHVCELSPIITVLYGLEKLEVRALDGKLAGAYIVKRDKKSDICMIFASELFLPPIEIAKENLKLGEIVYNISAPKSIYFPQTKTVPIIIGFYSGETESGNLFSMRIAPGSSGSAILNAKGELVSLCKAFFPDFDSLSLGITLKEIKKFLKPIR